MLKLYLYESTCTFMCYLLLSVSDYKALFRGKLATLTKSFVKKYTLETNITIKCKISKMNTTVSKKFQSMLFIKMEKRPHFVSKIYCTHPFLA